jgi:hypothetical protein
MVKTAARRAKVLVMLAYLNLVEIQCPPYTGAACPFQAQVPAKAMKSCDKAVFRCPAPNLRMYGRARYQFHAAGRW